MRGCSEAVLVSTAAELAREFKLGDRVLLEGPMGSGKTTFARALLLSLGIRQPPEGSPSFAIAHEYDAPVGGVVHIDFYRIRSEAEIDDAGIPSYYWERELLVISEWLSLWPEFEAQVRKSGRLWQVRLEFSTTGAADQRDLEIAFQEDSL
ncbi:MAG: tRNA (adenosine(37)-N6)-threonylcarbamoyltransferase complex ATPase subunit type 1 TsaE [Bdellovibrionales bacterium RIFOXYC1_FULL_54_43]|nr:MAG: tRNA (adenosine(37)-N6)-threonylcarbamoyltransferase complex ATPase subunit type 1 TsaE [Bdellovibrionales bacterium RIFOXYC1_FULL_54_43]OFZ80601.1 MAG: tRNA (adenosine(37)-N6)-threonylcarbamoyltransferase complex ATPase subunit type 1 TsaE [Bdellovibrionales bacterium RIFOXYD1_FULL_55_31]